MRQKRLTGSRLRMGTLLLLPVFAMTPVMMQAQDQPANSTMNSADSQTDQNVMTALGTSKELSNVAINTDTHGGVVTLTGTVSNQHQKQIAEGLTAHASGVTHVVNNLTISSAPVQNSANQPANEDQSANGGQPSVAGQPGSQPPAQRPTETDGKPNTAVLMSDGSMSDGSSPADQNGAEDQNASGNQNGPGDQYGPPQQGPNGGQPYGSPNGQYAQRAPMRRPAQIGGRQVMVQAGAMLRIRTLQPLDSRNLKAGATFNAVVLNDVMAGGQIAIPRGAELQGSVLESKKAGAFGGRGKLVITLDNVAMGGQGYMIASDAWSNEGPSKTGRTVGNAIGLGAVGALIGAAAGGGPGAAIGAAAGGATGIAASGASPTMQAFVPAEAVLIFHLQKPLPVTTVGQDELDRLAANVPPMQRQPGMQRRGAYGGYPPPPPAYYNQQPY